jgi:hypothetical protein
LVTPIDAPAPTNSFGDTGDSLVLARYIPSEHLIEVRGAYSPGLAPTLVHELNHALQDQHFGLSFSGKNSDESLAYRALVEGDAMLGLIPIACVSKQRTANDEQRPTTTNEQSTTKRTNALSEVNESGGGAIVTCQSATRMFKWIKNWL